jgi:hypothetical protein
MHVKAKQTVFIAVEVDRARAVLSGVGAVTEKKAGE